MHAFAANSCPGCGALVGEPHRVGCTLASQVIIPAAPIDGTLVTNRKSGDLYRALFEGLDCTNERDGLRVVHYVRDTGHVGAPFVREAGEFWRKFEMVSMQVRTRQRVRVFVDMDGVAVDFDGYSRETGLSNYDIKYQPGHYRRMKPIPGAIEALRELIALGFEVWFATKPPTGSTAAFSEKAEWATEHIPEMASRVIVTFDKGLLGCSLDFLCDDRPHKANCEEFPGTLLRFVDGYHWEDAMKVLRLHAPNR